MAELERPNLRAFGAPSTLTGERIITHRGVDGTIVLGQGSKPLKECGSKDLKYFEVVILTCSTKGTGIHIGLAEQCKADSPVTRNVGTNAGQISLSSNTGLLFVGSPNASQRFSTPIKPGETIGCGFDLNSNDVFFTRNGTRLPSNQVLQNFVGDVALRHFPTITLGSEHDSVLVHFQRSFDYQRARGSPSPVTWKTVFAQWTKATDQLDFTASPRTGGDAASEEGLRTASRDGLSVRRAGRAAEEEEQTVAVLTPSLMSTGRVKRLVPPGTAPSHARGPSA
jgi:hypothetical protein